MKPLFFISTLTILFFASCSSNKNKLPGEWEFANMIDPDHPTQLIEFEYPALRSSVTFTKDGYFMLVYGGRPDVFHLSDFFADSLYLKQDMNNVFWGNWNLSETDSMLEMTVKSLSVEGTLRLKLHAIDQAQLTLNINLAGPNATDQDLIMECTYNKNKHHNISSSEYNYMSPEMNAWRIPSRQKETQSEIVARIQNSLEFALVFLKYHAKDHLGANPAYLNPIPPYFAGNGIALEQKPTWEKLFFDEEDANISYNILRTAITNATDIPDEYRNKPLSMHIFIIEELLKNIQ